MRVNRLFSFCATIFFVCLFHFLGLSGHYDYTATFEAVNLGNKIKLEGILNMASVYFAIVGLLPLSLILFVVFITGKQVNYLPKIFWQLYGLVVIFGFFYGVNQHSELESKIQQKGYIECKDERVISSKYSSRTYALTVEECKGN